MQGETVARNDRLGSVGAGGSHLGDLPLWRGSVETPRSRFVPVKHHLLLCHSAKQPPEEPPLPGRCSLSQAMPSGGNGSSLCVSARVLLQRRSLSWVTGDVQCQVIAPHRLLLLSTMLLQTCSFYRQLLLLQNPFSSPVAQQVLVFTGNECIKGGVGRLEPTGRSHKFGYKVSSTLLPGWRLLSLWCPSIPPHPVPLLRGPAGAPACFGICRVLLCHGA